MQYNLSYSFVGFIFLLVLALYYSITRKFPNRASQCFKFLIILSTISVGLDFTAAYTINVSYKIPVNINYLLNTIFFLCYWSLAIVFQRYLLIITKQEKNFKALKNISSYVFYPVIMLIVASSPFSKLIFYFDSNKIYQHGALYIPCAIINLSIVFSGVFIVLIRNQKITKVQRYIIPLYSLLLILSNTIQLITPQILLNGTILALAIYVMFLTLQNPNEYRDRLSQKYTRVALIEYLYELVAKNIPFQFISIDIAGTDKFNKVFGENIGNAVIISVANRISEKIKTGLIFRIEGDSFVIINKEKKEYEKNIEIIKNSFPFTIEENGLSLTINIHLSYSEPLFGFKSEDEAFSVIKECSLVAKKSNNNLINKTSIERFNRQKKIQNALRNAITGDGIEVYLQPIFDVNKNSFTVAEALCRINDKELGIIMPNEFIPLAEKEGLIAKIDEIMFDKICFLISRSIFPQKIEQISVNLSAMDCLNRNLTDSTISIIKKYGVPANKLILEITETMATIDPAVKHTMEKLSKAGIVFSMDDFGTGYANLDSLINLPFGIVKIDRQVTKMISNSRYNIIIRGLLNTLNKLDFTSVIEGVETKEQKDRAVEMGCDFIQGYYFSKPLPIRDFVEFINNN